MREMFDVMIIGGGIVGLSAAIAMSQRNYKVAVIDAGSLTMDVAVSDTRVYAINQASQSLLQALDVWSQLDKARISPYRHMHVWDAANGACIDFDARLIGTSQLGVILEEAIMRQALLQRASQLGIMLFPQSRVNHVQTGLEQVQVSSSAGSWYSRLLMVADGATSATRQLLGVVMTSWPYHQHAIVGTVQTEKPHQATAYQVFNSDGPLAFLPLSDPQQCSIVWSTTPAHAEALMAMSEPEFNQKITAAFSAKLGLSQLVSKRHQFPLYMRHASQYHGVRWMLMGDAAHTIHPLAGLGLNVGLADVSAWLDIIDQSKSPMWAEKTLGAYQRRRKHAVWQIIGIMEALKALFANPLSPVKRLRGAGLSACNTIPMVKRFFIEQAAGQGF